MVKCIQCNQENDDAICPGCADRLVTNMSHHDRLAHALVGMDSMAGKRNLQVLLNKYKQLSTEALQDEFINRIQIAYRRIA